VVHTGQHYDDTMSESFFRDLGLQAPDLNLHVGSGTHACQTAAIMIGLEPVLAAERPDWVVVYGDVNSTVAAALVAAKLRLPLAHVEAGLRSGDRTMPEEINRIVTDRLADLLLTPSRDADAVLLAEGEPAGEIVFVGNVMIDSMLYALAQYRSRVHRPSNVDDPIRLRALVGALREAAAERPVLFPAHPRTRARLAEAAIDLRPVQVTEPMRYTEMVGLIESAHAVVRLRGPSGGDDGPRCPLPDCPINHGTADHHSPRNESPRSAAV
jgi:UDP-N-acetylglucosamine 2-epimerase (non-hydrolysing)